MTDAGRAASDDARARRPAPRYGEYATPEEVAALRGPDAEPLTPPAPPPPTTRPLPGPPPAGQARAAGWDRILTIGLLAYGAWNVVSSIIAFLDMRAVVAEGGRLLGADDVRMPDWVQGAGYGLIALYVVLFAGAILWSQHRLRHGRVTFWVPLTAGVIGGLACGILIDVALLSSGALTSLTG